MFVGYENFSTYFVDNDDVLPADPFISADDTSLPNEYQLDIRRNDPWFAESASDDFVILAEFYELEGPMARVTDSIVYIWQ